MDDPWGWNESEAKRRAEEAERGERERQTLARLLLARGHRRAAAIVAMATFRSLLVDGWDNGQYDGVLSVPAELYDRVDEQSRDVIAEAARAVIGPARFSELCVEIQLSELVSGWDVELLTRLRDGGDADEGDRLPALES